MKKLFLAFAVLALLCLGASAQAVVVIDGFSDYMTPVVAPAMEWPSQGWEILPTTAGQTYVETGLSGVVGGTRKTVLWSSSSVPSYSIDALLVTTAPDNSLGFANSTNSWSTVSLVYDANGAGLNLNASSGTKFSADMWFDHLGNGRTSTLSMTVIDGMANTSTVSRTWSTYTIPNPNPETYSFLFSEFAGINFGEIDSITLSYSSDNGNDWAFYPISSDIAVPEPSSIIALLGGLGSLLAFRRRRA